MKRKTKLFTLIGPPEAGKVALAEALAEAFGQNIELLPRTTNKPSESEADSPGQIRRVTPTTLRRKLQDGNLILTKVGEHISGFDKVKLDKLLRKKHVVMVTNEDGVRYLQEQIGRRGRPKYDIVVIRVIPHRRRPEDSDLPPSLIQADMEILIGLADITTDRAVHEISRHWPDILQAS